MGKCTVELNDVPDVIWTAKVLGITEFEVFGAAYHAWYHEPATERLLEQHFVPYMFQGIAPFWVRQFIRNTREQIPEWINTEILGNSPTHSIIAWLAQIAPASVVLALMPVQPYWQYGESATLPA